MNMSDPFTIVGEALVKQHAVQDATALKPDAIMVPQEWLDGITPGLMPSEDMAQRTMIGLPMIVGPRFALLYDYHVEGDETDG